jgi:PAS domain S-box-containing protein
MLVDRSYTAAELEPFNVLKHPVWVSDVENQSMHWANTAAVAVWNADSLDALLSRDLKSDMTDATKYRMDDILRRCRDGEILTEQVTLYPKNIPTTLNLSASGIRIGLDAGERVMVLIEAEIAEKKYEESTIRGLELLRHLPLPVFQFSIDGKSLYKNPEALRVYGCDEKDFFGHFVEKELGKKTFQQVVEGQEDCNIEAEHFTADGSTRWFSASLRRARDPVSSDNVILLTARDITEVLQARKDGATAKLKGEFLAVLAHDIRTPLHQIIG